jgi:hypothetical protein
MTITCFEQRRNANKQLQYWGAAVAATVMQVARVAQAQQEPVPFPHSVEIEEQLETDPWDRRVALLGYIGYGPLGLTAATLEFSPARYVALEAGAGWGLDGIQAGVLPRLRLPLTSWFALSGGVALTVGDYDADDDHFSFDYQTPPGPSRVWRPAVIGSVLAALEFRARGGFAARLEAGIGGLLNKDAMICTFPDPDAGSNGISDCTAGGQQFAFLDAGFGYAFE